MSMQKEQTLGTIPVPEATTRLQAFRFDYPARLWFQTKTYTDDTCEAEIESLESEGDFTEEEKEIILDGMRKAVYEVLSAREENAEAIEV